MSKLLDRCKKCVDSVYIDWEKTHHPDKHVIEKYEVWGIVHLALYILNFDEYNELKQYIYDSHGYDVGGVKTGQMEIDDYEVEDE